MSPSHATITFGTPWLVPKRASILGRMTLFDKAMQLESAEVCPMLLSPVYSLEHSFRYRKQLYIVTQTQFVYVALKQCKFFRWTNTINHAGLQVKTAKSNQSLDLRKLLLVIITTYLSKEKLTTHNQLLVTGSLSFGKLANSNWLLLFIANNKYVLLHGFSTKIR